MRYTKRPPFTQNSLHAPSKGLQSFDGEKFTNYIIPTTSVESDNIPADFSILNIYPNPFNISTTISFTLPSSGFSTLAVFNTAGQKIRELVSGILAAGTHSVTWNGRDDYGQPVSSSIYLSQLKSGPKMSTQRMMLVK